jgi:aryl-alcohol dehydrogenase-like predicted oxidoreductase
MEFREFGRTGWKTSAIGFGAWEIGGEWGQVDDNQSLKALHKAVEMGINFFDTSDVYGHSEEILGKFRKEANLPIIIATKAGRRINPHTAEGYNKTNLMEFVNSSLKKLQVERLDLLQLHCPPFQVYYQPETFGILDDLVQEGKLRFYGVSVQKVEEGLKALEYPNLQSVQIVFNLFRQRPAELFLSEANRRKVAVIARVPLASGMLTGKMKPDTQFDKDDHRVFNRKGEVFDKGETFSGVEYETGLQAVEEIRRLLPQGLTMAQFALRWILMFPQVTCAIPGARTPSQVTDNASSVDFPGLTDEVIRKIKGIYDLYIRNNVHHNW